MKKTVYSIFALLIASASLTVQARDSKLMMPISAALEAPQAKEKLGDTIKFYFGAKKTPKILNKLGSDTTSLKTNAFNKSDSVACNWVFLSAMLSLQKHAREVGANAIVNIVSYHDKVEVSSETEFECHAGGLMASVSFKADFVKIAE